MKVIIEFRRPRPIEAMKRKARKTRENASKLGQSFKRGAQGFAAPWKQEQASG